MSINSVFVSAKKMLFVLCVCMLCRISLYAQYVATHADSMEFLNGVMAICVVGFVVSVCFTLVIHRAMANRTMMKGGAYRLVAHPVYALYILGDIPLWYLTPLSVFSVTRGILFYVVIFITAYLEESGMIQRFGEEAIQYYRRTPSIHMLFGR